MSGSASYQPGRAAGLASATAEHRDMGAAYAVSLPVFEGPLDLLLHLIEQEQLDISTVSLVAVTDQYLRAIEQMERPAPGALADFLVVASRLLFIKSTRLLPKPLSADEDEEDAGATLVRHLLEYRQFKRVADGLRAREGELRVFPRPPGATDLPEPTTRVPEFGELDVQLLRKALQKALARIVLKPVSPNVAPYTVTVAERMAGIRLRFAALSQGDERSGIPRQLSFEDLLIEADSRLAIIVTFLAVLELMKQEEVAVIQEGTFGAIMLAPLVHSPGDSDGNDSDSEESASASQQEESAAEDTRTGETE